MKLKQLHRGQPIAKKKKVWDKDEHLGRFKSRWYNKSAKTKPYNWSKTGTFHGQSEGYNDHII